MTTLLQRCIDMGLDAEILGAVRDAERYRFIRDADRSDRHLPMECLVYAMESLDEAIDAAMQQEQQQ